MSALDPKALKAAQNAYWEHGGRALSETSPDRLNAAITAYLAASPKGQVEAVAQWQILHEGEWVNEDAEMVDHWRTKGYEVRALYASPAPSGGRREGPSDAEWRSEEARISFAEEVAIKRSGLVPVGTVIDGGVFWHRNVMDKWLPEGAKIYALALPVAPSQVEG